MDTSTLIHFPVDSKFPRIKSDECLNHAGILVALFDDPGYWYQLVGRSEFWDRTNLSRKRLQFYEIYIGLIVGILNLWSSRLIIIGELKNRQLFVSRTRESNNQELGYFENSLFRICEKNRELSYEDLLDTFIQPHKDLRRFFQSFNRSLIRDYDSLFATVGLAQWFIDSGKKVVEADETSTLNSLSPDYQSNQEFVFYRTLDSIMMKTESFVLKQRWCRLF
ncbi:hypothetical protein [Leptospira stimsonii]|uniref:Uncharacterized protein n=1 Tax=Leptospira stimsonii TaxID=2202203 RepID=A0A396YT44_9LEPT|nr:hypothetical protein [Leptospira stimsonii]RHX85745.1 hypothetical protein DLM75_19655 [Leptospira stimsonii]